MPNFNYKVHHYGCNRKKTIGRTKKQSPAPFTRLVSLHFGNSMKEIDSLTAKMYKNFVSYGKRHRNEAKIAKHINALASI